MPSLLYMCLRWTFTVSADIASLRAISFFEQPLSMRWPTSSSRAESGVSNYWSVEPSQLCQLKGGKANCSGTSRSNAMR